MDENLLFRMNFILQDNSATTIDANLVKFIEYALAYIEADSASIVDIKEQIEKIYGLEFTIDEIDVAIKRKGKRISVSDGRYFIKPEYRASIVKTKSVSDELMGFVVKAKEELNLEASSEELHSLMMDYLYYCFNSNKATLLSLIKSEEVKVRKHEFDNNQIFLINSFLQWDNPEKNRCIYKIISYCYTYCSLTTKKDKILGTKLFYGKRFLLDANIIFRLAGINNDSRKLTISSFAKKCKEVGITLCYTTNTFDEIYRVIKNKVQSVKRIAGYEEPIDWSEFVTTENDFYKLYCSWSRETGHRFDDYSGFQRYLEKLVDEVLTDLKLVQIPDYKIRDKEAYNEHYNSLESYKSEHTTRRQSSSSLKTDTYNIMYIYEQRSKCQAADLWSVNDFLISADQNLINWALDEAGGVPSVVLPSVWLTIMLRFSGRAIGDDDYKAFCSFLELRTHSVSGDIDIYALVERLGEKTSSTNLKKQIVKEIYEHKSDYQIEDDEDYDKAVERAFDTIVNKMTAKENEDRIIYDEERKKDKAELEKMQSDLILQREADDQKRASSLAKSDCEKRFKIVDFIDKSKLIIGTMLLIGIVWIFALTFLRKGILFDIIVFCNKDNGNIGIGDIASVLGVVALIFAPLAFILNAFVNYLSSEKRKARYVEKRKDYYLSRFKIEGN